MMKIRKYQYLSVILMYILITWVILVLDLGQAKIVLNKYNFSIFTTLQIIFSIQFIFFIYFIINNIKYMKGIFKREFYYESIVHFLIAGLAIIYLIGFFIWNGYDNLLFKLEIIILSAEIILCRLIEVKNREQKIFSKYNFLFNPKADIKLIRNTEYDNLYGKSYDFLYSFFIAYGIQEIFSIFLNLVNVKHIFGIDLLIIFIIIFIMRKKFLFRIDVRLQNLIIIKCTCLDIKVNPQHGGGRSSYTYYLENCDEKIKVSFVQSYGICKRGGELTVIMGGISHFIIDIYKDENGVLVPLVDSKKYNCNNENVALK